MIESRDTHQGPFFGNLVYDKVVLKDHILRLINKSVDFSFVKELAKDAYCNDNGHPVWSSLLIHRLTHSTDVKVKAKVNLYCLKKEHKDCDPDPYIDKHSLDKDVRPGRKHKGV